MNIDQAVKLLLRRLADQGILSMAYIIHKAVKCIARPVSWTTLRKAVSPLINVVKSATVMRRFFPAIWQMLVSLGT
jgi:hypothetical protein